MGTKPKSLVHRLSRRGPHRVMRGDLAYAGLPGIVCAPATGLGLPAVVFAHGWLTAPERYLDTVSHLASWGFAVAAPATHRGAVPSAREFAHDLSTAVDIVTGVRLGAGAVSVQPGRVALVGHGFGAGAAALAAHQHLNGRQNPGQNPAAERLARRRSRTGYRQPIAAVGALYPEPTNPPAESAAPQASALILAAPDADDAPEPEAARLADVYGTRSTTRIVPAASEGDIVEGRRIAKFLGLPASDKKLQRTTRACLTGYLLATLRGDREYSVFTDQETALPRTAVPEEPESRDGEALGSPDSPDGPGSLGSTARTRQGSLIRALGA